jgi:LysM repeat protein
MAISSVASKVFGFGPGSSGLEKLTIYYEKERPEDWGNSLEALFNPGEFGLSRTVTWETQYAGGPESGFSWQEFCQLSPETLTINLFFDAYEKHGGGRTLKGLATAVPASSLFLSPEATSVKVYTDKIAELAQINQELHRPPLCKLTWGRFEIFRGVLNSLSQQFTMFMPDGTPVRATVDCTFTEYMTEGVTRSRELHSADVPKTHRVRDNETLQSIAAQKYNDPTLWRRIARANNLVNPRALKPGTVLIIPTLT